MKQLFAGEILDIVIQPTNIIFSYVNERIGENDIDVHFKMFSLENNVLSDVTKNVYLLAKYGASYQAVKPFCDNYVLTRVLHLSGGRMFICNASGKAVLLDSQCVATWTGELRYKGIVPNSLALDGDNMWGCFSSLDTVLRFNTTTLREELRIGKKGSALATPSSLFVQNGTALVCLAGANRIVKINLSDYSFEDKYYFSEPVFYYAKVMETEFVVLKSGLYEVEV